MHRRRFVNLLNSGNTFRELGIIKGQIGCTPIFVPVYFHKNSKHLGSLFTEVNVLVSTDVKEKFLLD